jgi:hypothetical protein
MQRVVQAKAVNTQQTKEAIRQRLMYSFGFTYEQADYELQFLIASISKDDITLFTEDWYVLGIVRKGAGVVLNRKTKKELYKHVKAIVEGI